MSSASIDDVSGVLQRMNSVMTTQYSSLKDKQTAAITECQKRNDVLVVLPTGYGKTVIIQANADLVSCAALPFLTAENACVVIINGLTSIIQEQKTRFGDKAIVIDDEIIKYLEDLPTPNSKNQQTALIVQRLTDGDAGINYIISHPEHIVHPEVKKILMKKNIANRITHLVVDEAHCILSWGNSDFRTAYQKLGLLRAVMKDSNILALTATANGMSQKNICSSLRMKEPVIIVESPDRPNVYLSVEKRPPSTGGENTAEESMFKTVDPIIQELKTKMENYRKTIVYVPLKWCGVLHQRTVTSIGNVTSDTEAESFSPIVSQYHSPQSQQLKAWITQDMKDLEKGSLRLLYATEAYGMGIDVPDVRHVVHIGPPSTMETFVQEIGRCGRDGEPSSATLFYNNTDLCSTNLNEKMKMYVKNTSICRRQVLLNHFEAEVDKTRNAHNCCDICRRTCQCSLCISTHIEITSASESLLFNKNKRLWP
ncbi:unnamed protein product [Mytilus edulis]|uniref:DNA 3'-5' helicase n=2 Tax=Mytilus TaxID=6548 RepID=A0A8S3R3M5_MYTED|nr:unnamed protein product [Mytilus edulis]